MRKKSYRRGKRDRIRRALVRGNWGKGDKLRKTINISSRESILPTWEFTLRIKAANSAVDMTYLSV